jgi:hypothetical protein
MDAIVNIVYVIKLLTHISWYIECSNEIIVVNVRVDNNNKCRQLSWIV